MSYGSFQQVLVHVLAGCFAAGAVVHVIGPAGLRAAYAGWGYPRGFRFVTALCHAAVAGLLAWPAGRVAGVTLALTVTLAAAATLARHGQWQKTPASVVLAAALVATLL